MNSTSQPTPGPWSTGDADWRRIVGAVTRVHHGGHVAAPSLVGVAMIEESDDIHEDEANARLIAAAPELLAACRATRAYFASVESLMDPMLRPVMLGLQAAIERAEGQS